MSARARWVAAGLLVLVLLAVAGCRSIYFLAGARDLLLRAGWRSERLDARLAEVHEKRGRKLADKGSPEAGALFLAALRIWRDLGWHDRAAAVREELAAHQAAQGRIEEALAGFSENLGYFEATGQGTKAVDMLVWIGHCHFRRGSFDSALQVLGDADGRAEMLGYHLGRATAANNLGYVYQRRGEFEAALNQYRRATELFSGLERLAEAAGTWDNRFACLMVLGRMQEAKAALDAALEIEAGLGKRKAVAPTLTHQGWYYALNREPEKALDSYRQALEIQREAGNRPAQVGILDRMGSAWVELGLYVQGRAAYLEAAGLAAEGSGDQAKIFSNLCRLGVLEGRLKDAEGYCRRANELLVKLEEPSAEAAAAHWAARQYLMEGDLAAAQAQARRSVEILENLRLEVGAPSRRAEFFSDRQRYYRVLIEVLLALHRQHPGQDFSAQAFEAAEKTRSRSLLDLLRSDLSDPERQTLKAILQKESELRLQLDQAFKADNSSGPDRNALERYERVESWLREQLDQPGSAGLSRELSSLLDPGTLVLAYSLGEKASQLWLIDVSSIRLLELPPKAEIDRLASSYFSLVSSPDSLWAEAQLQVVGMQLAAALLGPAAEKLRARRLVVIPDGLISYIPFGSLPDPANPAEPLLDRFEIASLPSLTLLKVLRERSGRKPRSFDTLVVADPVYGLEDPRLGPRRSSRRRSDWARLQGTAREAGILGERAPGRFTAWTGFEARRSAVLEGALKGYSLVHFATHGWIDAESPEESALILSAVDRDGSPLESHLRVRDLFGLDLNAELVVASACRTGLGGDARGEGMTNFTSGFLLAGGNRVLVSLWPIEDGTTAVLMDHFYEALLERRLSAAAALRLAQLEVRKNPETSAPFYWSPFILQGDWESFPIPEKPRK